MNITQFIKNRILDEYGSIRRFSRKIGIPTSTLNTALNKERGFNTMPIENALKVCSELGLDVLSLYDKESEPLTTNEQKLVNIYHSVSQAGKDMIMTNAEAVKQFEDNKVITFMPILNESRIPTVELDYYDQAAGMGTGQIVEDAIPKKINILASQVPPKTDFIIRVYGDSMEPTYHSEDKLFIESTNVLDAGDIGVFNFRGETLVKEYRRGELISHNKKYQPIKIDESVYIQGRVLGKV